MDAQTFKVSRERNLLVRLGVVLSGLIAIYCLVWFLFLRPIQGTYTGRILDSLSADSVFLLKDGAAYIKPIDGKPIPYGRYSQRENVWILTTGTNQDWILEKQAFGFDMISATDRTVRYKFVRKGVTTLFDY